MRDIKFRAWDSELKFFTSQLGYFLEFDGSAWFNLGAAADGEDSLIDQSKKLIIEQFTGLKDKNGVEIYEGDISKWADDKTYQVKWSEAYSGEQWCLVGKDGENSDFYGGLHDPECLEIIGNIHEHPELLEADK